MSRFTRFLTLFVAAFQFAAPAVASVAEGTFTRRVVDPTPHVEEHGQKDCVPPHATDCGICRYLANATGPIAVAPLPADLGGTSSVAVVTEALASGVERQGFEARGPPSAQG